MKTAKRLCRAVAEQKWKSTSGDLNISISLGVASLSRIAAQRAKDLVVSADKALMQGKEGGRNQVCRFSEIQ